MKAVILAGGLGTRISEETGMKPKPMIEIGGKPVLWHIMKIYAAHGVNDFVICCGYKGYVIKEYFANYFLHMSDVTFDMVGNSMEVHQRKAEPWRVTLIDTGEETMTGGRLKRVAPYVKDEETFCFTYGDGVANVEQQVDIRFTQTDAQGAKHVVEAHALSSDVWKQVDGVWRIFKTTTNQLDMSVDGKAVVHKARTAA